MQFKSDKALANALKNKFRKYPSKNDNKRFSNGIIFPNINPKFKISRGKVFTIGSCFARHIEEILTTYEGFYLPTLKFKVPKERMVS
ncbi:hypothetical protein TAGGR_220 [Thermodesulfovibrio aggregans]|uniref:GSCFA domain-containing protein n=1 Tax=Thermodesulfovibrio aggregans TaxID=86166 RepID=A0A0U9HQ20_9BACT|nr:hypothetical protein [Thermodesulfovibrio aggregans]GAQ95136.1 hypothetical protein TAGGR_220 [Thermodesulfovibrio aggregans]